MKGDYYFILTKNCNLKCGHCYMSAGPGLQNTTIDEKDFRKCINHLPKFQARLALSGGEIFTIKNKLYGFLDYLKYANKKREKNNWGKLELSVQTNGFWGKSKENSIRILNELYDFGVTELDLSSADDFHKEQGIKKEWLKNIKFFAEEIGFEDVTIRGAEKGFGIFPSGRGKEIYNPRIRLNRKVICKKSLKNYYLTIHEDGKVYNCCWGVFSLPGNLIDEPLINIVRRAKRNSKFKILEEGKILDLAVHDGWKKADVRDLIETYGKCAFCALNYCKENQ